MYKYMKMNWQKESPINWPLYISMKVETTKMVVKLIKYGLDRVNRKRKQQKAENANSLDINVSNMKQSDTLNTFQD